MDACPECSGSNQPEEIGLIHLLARAAAASLEDFPASTHSDASKKSVARSSSCSFRC